MNNSMLKKLEEEIKKSNKQLLALNEDMNTLRIHIQSLTDFMERLKKERNIQ